MAHLLGSQACIDSLRVDVEDLQTVVHEIVGKTGSIKCHSWKFPDKIATDIDIAELLQRYQYGKHEVDNQVSHIVLFEVIIDRLLLVLHGSWRYLNEIQNQLLPHITDSSSMTNQPTSLSVGLVVKKYWNKLLHLSTLLQQNENDRKRSNGSKTAPVLRPKSSLNVEKRPASSNDPCVSCQKLQQGLHDHADSLISLCQTYNLPSSLAHYRSTNKSDYLSLDDINHWSDCQSKDIDRLSKHLEYLNNTLNKCKSDLELMENRSKKQEENNRRLQQLINDDKQSKRVLQELHDQKLVQMKSEHDQREKQLEQQIQLLNNQKCQLEGQMKEVQQLCQTRAEQIEQLETSKNELKILVQDRMRSDEAMKILEQDKIRLQTELDLVKHDLEERHRELQKERTRIENMIRQEQAAQAKQRALTHSYETLIEECDGLKKQVNELENARDELEKLLETAQQRSSTVEGHKESHGEYQREIVTLKSNIEQLHQRIQQMSEREQMLLQYPDLNGPIEHEPTTNNLMLDMQNQIRTNEIRIELLRKQNESLKSSLEKLLQAQHQPQVSMVSEERYQELRSQSRPESSYRRFSVGQESTPPPKTRPAPLWALNHELLEQEKQNFTEPRSMMSNTFIPRFSENDYVANGWIKSEPDPLPLNTSNSESNPSPKPNDRAWATPVPRPQHHTDLVITAESRPPSASHSSRTLTNGRTSTLPPPTDFEMIIGKGRTTSRPSSATKLRQNSAHESSRRDASLPKSSRPPAASAKATRSTTSTALHQCTNCNKTYDDKRNYDIHKLYCRN